MPHNKKTRPLRNRGGTRWDGGSWSCIWRRPLPFWVQRAAPLLSRGKRPQSCPLLRMRILSTGQDVAVAVHAAAA
jgi:hypothetical protein